MATSWHAYVHVNQCDTPQTLSCMAAVCYIRHTGLSGKQMHFLKYCSCISALLAKTCDQIWILEQRLSAVQSLLLPDYLAAGFRHSTASAHAVIPKAQHAEHMIDSHHTGHTAGSPASQCTAESNACLLCKAFCCLFTLLQGFRHSRASAHVV